jgi:hypothetical protein
VADAARTVGEAARTIHGSCPYGEGTVGVGSGSVRARSMDVRLGCGNVRIRSVDRTRGIARLYARNPRPCRRHDRPWARHVRSWRSLLAVCGRQRGPWAWYAESWRHPAFALSPAHAGSVGGPRLPPAEAGVYSLWPRYAGHACCRRRRQQEIATGFSRWNAAGDSASPRSGRQARRYSKHQRPAARPPLSTEGVR